jgi:hypothetical protein
MNNPELEALRAFRPQVYRMLGQRRDALFDTLDAILTANILESPVYLSLAPSFQRHWGSIYDALNAGTMDLPGIERLVAEYPLETPTTWYAVDASVWPRCDAETSPERGYYHHHSRHSHGQPIVAGWNYSWLVQTPERCASWTAPMRMRRMTPGENSNQVAAEQVRSLLRQRSHAKLPIISFDAGYDPVQLGVALADRHDALCLLVRLRSGRCFYADPPVGPTGGRPRRHGAKFVCDDPDTWPVPSAAWRETDPRYGVVQLRAWHGLHAIPQNHAARGTRHAKPVVRGTLIRLQVEHLPHPTKAPVPLWLWWWGPTPPDLATVWRVYVARFSIEHTFRFFKQVLKWTAPKLRSPDAADRWTWLLILAYGPLRLARGLVRDRHLPWQRGLPPEKLSPARVRRDFSHVLAQVGSPAFLPKPCGRSPGRPNGARSPPALRYPAIKLTP